MGNCGISNVCGCIAVLASLAGCAGSEISEEAVSQSTQAVVGVDEYLYLRCNATGWGADSGTLLRASEQAGIYALEYNVSANYMVSGGDQCVLTRTNSANGWGSVSATFGASSTSAVVAPGQWSIGAVNSAPVTIKYPAIGRYRASVNWTTRTVSIAAANTTPPTPPATANYYLRCNATGWNVGSSNRFVAATSGLSLNYSVKQDWMVSSGDQCVVTRTNQVDGWGTSQTTLGTATATKLVVPAASGVTAALVSAGQQFTVRYPAVGQYQASFDPTTGQLRIAVQGPSVPETGLHGAVESLGNNRVRVTYDFEKAEQLQDFVTTDATLTAVSLSEGRLLVEDVGGNAANPTRAAKLIKGFKVDSMQYQAELKSGELIGVYVGTLWDGQWNPLHGYGAIHWGAGRQFIVNSKDTPIADSTPVAIGTQYSGRIDANEQGLTWTVDGNIQTLDYPYYGGTTRTVALGGYASTVAFDNVVIEGTVEGMESDGTETNPGVNHGTVVNLPDGRVRISYDFSDPQQKFDFVANSASTRRELLDGRLIVSSASSVDPVKVALYKYNLRVDRLSFRAELLAGDHISYYLNTIWDGNWSPSVGCAGIHWTYGRLFSVDGTVTDAGDSSPTSLRAAYVGDVISSSTGLNWTANGISVTTNAPCYSGTDGVMGIGSYESDVAFDDVVIEGQLQ